VIGAVDVSSSGDLAFRNTIINVGRRYGRARVRVIEIGGLTHVYDAEGLIRTLQIDPKVNYQRRKGVPELTTVMQLSGTRCHTSPRNAHTFIENSCQTFVRRSMRKALELNPRRPQFVPKH
jgi:hypothetical protein